MSALKTGLPRAPCMAATAATAHGVFSPTPDNGQRLLLIPVKSSHKFFAGVDAYKWGCTLEIV